MKKGNIVKLGLLFAAVFGFALGLASVHTVSAKPDPCCTIPATPICTEGIGMWIDDQCVYCFPCPGACEEAGDYGCCVIQVAPQCD